MSTTSSRPGACVLAINGGSSSLKFAVFAAGDPPVRLWSGKVERIGLEDGRWALADAAGGEPDTRAVVAPDHAAAARLVITWLEQAIGKPAIEAVGHRVVHGGPRFHQPERVTGAVVEELRRLSPLDPEHLPGEIALIEAFGAYLSGVPHVACFDTAFHHDLPRVARIMPIPRRYESLGVRRYGFHGISYGYLMQELARLGGAQGRVVLAHLGAGASLAAVRDGRCVETTMAFTPTAGLVMGRRSGDLDPGLVRYLMVEQGLSVEAFHRMVNEESGMLGVSETSPDLRDLLARRDEDVRAREAVALFVYRARLGIGALATALEGLDSLVFSGGIGEKSAAARAEICAGLAWLGARLDPARNEANAPIISTDQAPVTVRVIATDEESVLARHALAALNGSRAAAPDCNAPGPAR